MNSINSFPKSFLPSSLKTELGKKAKGAIAGWQPRHFEFILLGQVILYSKNPVSL